VHTVKWKGLTPDLAKSFYDKFGAKQDKQAFYEDKALKRLVDHGRFDTAKSVIEFGCGTGRFAELLFRSRFPAGVAYTGTDISTTMLGLSKKRLAPFSSRVTLVSPQDKPLDNYPDQDADRFISNYMLDLLSDEDIQNTLAHAHRILTNDGLLCVTTITDGKGPLTRVVSFLWNVVFKLNPSWVGGCRPISIVNRLDHLQWNIVYYHVGSQFGISSEVLVASPRPF